MVMGAVSTGRKRRRSILAGLVLLTVGLVLLLNTTGAVSFAIWLELADYWPALLVLAGVEIISEALNRVSIDIEAFAADVIVN